MNADDHCTLVLKSARILGVRDQYVVPKGCHLTPTQISSELRHCLQSEIQTVKQPETGRDGSEFLALIGLDPSDAKADDAAMKMTAMLSHADQILAEANQMLGGKSGLPTSVKLTDLSRQFETYPRTKRAQKRPEASSLLLPMLALLLATGLLVTGFVAFSRFMKTNPDSGQASTDSVPASTDDEAPQTWAEAVGMDADASVSEIVDRINSLFITPAKLAKKSSESDRSDTNPEANDLSESNEARQKLNQLYSIRYNQPLKTDSAVFNDDGFRDELAKLFDGEGAVNPLGWVTSFGWINETATKKKLLELIGNTNNTTDRLIELRECVNELLKASGSIDESDKFDVEYPKTVSLARDLVAIDRTCPGVSTPIIETTFVSRRDAILIEVIETLQGKGFILGEEKRFLPEEVRDEFAKRNPPQSMKISLWDLNEFGLIRLKRAQD